MDYPEGWEDEPLTFEDFKEDRAQWQWIHDQLMQEYHKYKDQLTDEQNLHVLDKLAAMRKEHGLDE